MWGVIVEGEEVMRYPIRGIFVGCCAATEPQSTKRMAQRTWTMIFFFMNFSAYFSFLIFTLRPAQGMLLLFLFDHSIRSHQHIGRDRQADLLGRFEIDHQFEFRRLLDWQIGGLGAFQNLVDISRCTPK